MLQINVSSFSFAEVVDALTLVIDKFPPFAANGERVLTPETLLRMCDSPEQARAPSRSAVQIRVSQPRYRRFARSSVAKRQPATPRLPSYSAPTLAFSRLFALRIGGSFSAKQLLGRIVSVLE